MTIECRTRFGGTSTIDSNGSRIDRGGFITTSSPNASAPTSADLTFDLDCLRCGYNLRSRPVTGVCPECGQPILVTIEQHIRRRTASRIEHLRMRDRPLSWLRSVRDGGIYAILANGIGFMAYLFPDHLLPPRRTTERTVVLGLLCVAIAFAALSIWKFGAAGGERGVFTRLWRYLLRFGAIAVIGSIVLMTLTEDRRSYWRATGWLVHTHIGSLAVPVLAAFVGVGAALRLIYLHWWLRLERASIIAWPLLACAVPIVVFYGYVSLHDRWGFRWTEGDFISLDDVVVMPLASDSWPYALSRISRNRIGDSFEIMAVGLAIVGHPWVMLGDATLVWLSQRAIVRRRAELRSIPAIAANDCHFERA